MVIQMPILRGLRINQTVRLQDMQAPNVMILPTPLVMRTLRDDGYKLVHRPSNIVQFRQRDDDLPPEAA